MGGTKIGGQAAARTNKQRYGEKFYGDIGSIGGKLGHTGGFWYSKYVLKDGGKAAKEAGKVGGTISRRIKVKR